MVGSNKILTVSYGTFSCTLEGFEDSFGTMKAIAEYFRDLAADDRYFGAEPPVPDVQMLGRIAEREIARRVEARMDASGITLRTGEALPASMAAALQAAAPVSQTTLPAATVAAVGDVVGPEAEVIGDDTSMLLAASDPTIDLPAVIEPQVMDMPVVIEPQVDVTPAAAEPLMPPAAIAPVKPTAIRPVKVRVPDAILPPVTIPAHPDADSVAAKLQRIRAVVGRGTMPMAPQDFAEDLADNLPNAPADVEPAKIEEPLAEDLVAAFMAPDATQTDIAEDANQPFDMSGVTAALSVDDTDAAEAPVAPIAPVRARVIRMRRADFDRTTQDEAQVAPAIVVETAPDLTDPDTFDDLDALADLGALDGFDETGDDAFDAMFDGQPTDVAAELYDDIDADLPDDLAQALAAVEQDDTADIGSGTLSPDDEADLMQELAAVERETTAVLPTAAEIEEDIDDAVAPAAAAPDTTLDQLVAGPLETAAGIKDDAPLANDDIAALFDSPSDDEVFDFTAMHEPEPEAEADAPSEAVSEDAYEDEAEDDADEAVAPHAPLSGRDLLEREPEADAEAMERILSQTDAELNAPESSRRREAIAQLKAAVAATEAARRLGDLSNDTTDDEDENENDVESAFRDDLKQVVRPRRPVAEVKQPELGRERPKPAPLKLVASQRIDIPAPQPALAPVMPVRPRRVAVEADAMALPPDAAQARRQAGSFAEFAESMGAKALPDLLEAAAAYTSFVEGVEDFSRPQLMKKVQDMAETDFSREDGLRSFGTLLRQGRIMKTRNGRFAVNEETRFNPERRAG